MKRTFTHLLVFVMFLALALSGSAQTFVWDKSELTTGWSNGGPATTLKTSNGITLQQLATTGTVNQFFALDNSNLVPALTGTTDAATISLNIEGAYISQVKITYSSNSASVASPWVGYSTTISPMGTTNVPTDACEFDPAGVAGTTHVQKTYTPPINTKFVILTRGKTCGSSTSNTTTIRVSRIEVFTQATTPTIARTSGSNPASAMETLAMTPVVYTYSNVTNDANVLADWYTDNTYATTTSAPGGLSINKNTTARTVTVSGTPTTAGTYFYKVTVNETGGNFIEGVVNVSAYVTPAPLFTLTTGNNNQYPVKETAIANIVYTIAHSTGANTTGLPAGLAGVFDNGTYTISGTIAAEAATGVHNYTVTAVPLAGYSGADVTTTGKIVVKSTTAKQICYLVATATPSANDTKLYPMLMDNPNFIVTLRTAASTAPAASVYDQFDLIILNEIVAGANVEAVALRNVDKPILSLKAYTYTSGRWSWGTPNNGFAANSVITAQQPAHPVFNGLTLTGGTLSLVDNASGNTVQVNDVTTLPGRSIVVASAPKTDNVMAVAVHDVPAAVRGVSNSKYILIPIADANYHRMNNNALTMINNAIEYLLNGVQFQAPSLEIATMTHVGKNGQINHTEGAIYIPVYVGTELAAVIPEITLAGVGTTVTPVTAQNFTNSKAAPIVYTVSDMISTKQYAVTIEESTSAVNDVFAAGFVFDGRTLRNVNHEMIRVYNTTGRMMINSLNDIDMSQFGQGIYIIRSDNKVLKIAVTQ